VKRREFLRGLVDGGCYLKRHGANHDIYINPANGRVAPVPRHAEIRPDTRLTSELQLAVGKKTLTAQKRAKYDRYSII